MPPSYISVQWSGECSSLDFFGELIIMYRILFIIMIMCKATFSLSQAFLLLFCGKSQGWLFLVLCHQLRSTESFGNLQGVACTCIDFFFFFLFLKTYIIFLLSALFLVSFVFICCPYNYVFTAVFPLLSLVSSMETVHNRPSYVYDKIDQEYI